MLLLLLRPFMVDEPGVVEDSRGELRTWGASSIVIVGGALLLVVAMVMDGGIESKDRVGGRVVSQLCVDGVFRLLTT